MKEKLSSVFSKFNKVKVVEYGSLLLTVMGTIGSAWAGKKNNEIALQKLVAENMNKK